MKFIVTRENLARDTDEVTITLPKKTKVFLRKIVEGLALGALSAVVVSVVQAKRNEKTADPE